MPCLGFPLVLLCLIHPAMPCLLPPNSLALPPLPALHGLVPLPCFASRKPM